MLQFHEFFVIQITIIYLAFLQFSCFHLLNLPEEFSTKTHMVQSSPNSGETLTTSFLWSYGISFVNRVVWGMPPERSSKRNPPTSSLVLTYQLNSTWSSPFLKIFFKKFEQITCACHPFHGKFHLLFHFSKLNIRINLELGGFFGFITNELFFNKRIDRKTFVIWRSGTFGPLPRSGSTFRTTIWGQPKGNRPQEAITMNRIA